MLHLQDVPVNVTLLRVIRFVHYE